MYFVRVVGGSLALHTEKAKLTVFTHLVLTINDTKCVAPLCNITYNAQNATHNQVFLVTSYNNICQLKQLISTTRARTQFQHSIYPYMNTYSTIKLQTNQNNIIRIRLDKSPLQGSTKQNYRNLGVFPFKFFNKKVAIMFIF